MKLSIITPCYNAEKYLPAMIESVLQQSYSLFELIVVTDGSTDNSLKILESYAERDARIIVINGPNTGKPSIARNKGISIATGDIITFLDADDIYMSKRLELIIDAFNKHPQASIVIHDFNRISATGEVLSNGLIKDNWERYRMDTLFKADNNILISVNDIYFAFLDSWFFVHTSSISFMKCDYKEHELYFNETLLYFEDLSKWCELVVNKKVLYIDNVLSSYRDTPGSLMTNSSLFDLYEVDFFENHLLNPLLPLSDLTKTNVAKRQSKSLKDALYSLSRNGEVGKTISFSIRLLKTNLNLKTLAFLFKTFVIAVVKAALK